MKKIVIDLDVVTVALWDNDARSEHARRFVEKAKASFEILVPYTLLELARKWRYAELREKVLDFYQSGTEISAPQVEQKFEEFNVNDKELAISLISHGVKEEDAALVIIASLFKADFLVTFNRKHLKNKELEINSVLEKFHISKIRICQPQEIIEEGKK